MSKKRYILFVFTLVGIMATTSAVLGPPPLNPIKSIGPYLNGVFNDGISGGLGNWELVDAFPGIDIPSPVRVIPFDREKLLVLSKLGHLYIIDKSNTTSRKVLDISDKTFPLSDAGAVGVALHPMFGKDDQDDKQLVFVYYRTKPDAQEWDTNGFNVLSKFKWDNENQNFDVNSEEILIQQFDRMPWHDGGSMFFGDDGFLYLGVGDEGLDSTQTASTQRIDGGLFSGIFRIDVDMDPEKSHPIRRQPISLATPPSGWGNTYTQGYFIPNDNPWQDPEGGILEEYFALGIRSPYTVFPDPRDNTFWLCDVGSDKREEINRFTKADNMQWPYMEGTTKSENHERPENLIGNERAVLYEYNRDVGTTIIGGGVYDKARYQSLYQNFLFADYAKNTIRVLKPGEDDGELTSELLYSGLDSKALGIDESVNISGVFIQENGTILVSVLNIIERHVGKILELKPKEALPEPPEKLSDLGVFKDMETLEPVDGIIPYDVASPLWSDGAEKKRWIAIPHEGLFDEAHEKINFDALDNWKFPPGTVIIKQFDLPNNLQDSTQVVRLETRFIIITQDQKAYGVTYKWNDEGTEAYLLQTGDTRMIDIYDGPDLVSTQQWEYPSRVQCLDCHTQVTDYVLGVRTHQLNNEIFYPTEGRMINQLEFFNSHKIFDKKLLSSSLYPKAHPITDGEVPLVDRIRAYLDANCSNCHRPGHLTETDMHLRFHETAQLQNVLSRATQSHASTKDIQLVTPGHPELSELWLRDNSTDDNLMPPIGRLLVDQVYIDSLTKWIGTLEEPVIASTPKVEVYPNPAVDWINVELDDAWQRPIEMTLHDVQGKRVISKTINNYSAYIRCDEIPDGQYILVINDGKNKESIKVIVQ